MEKASQRLKRIVVDANPIISSLLRRGTSYNIIFDPNYLFYTTEFTIKEVEKYLEYISDKTGIDRDKINYALLTLPIIKVKRVVYMDKIKRANFLMKSKDPKDVDVLALALKLKLPLWSNDRHFEGVGEIKLLKTKDLLGDKY